MIFIIFLISKGIDDGFLVKQTVKVNMLGEGVLRLGILRLRVRIQEFQDQKLQSRGLRVSSQVLKDKGVGIMVWIEYIIMIDIQQKFINDVKTTRPLQFYHYSIFTRKTRPNWPFLLVTLKFILKSSVQYSFTPVHNSILMNCLVKSINKVFETIFFQKLLLSR